MDLLSYIQKNPYQAYSYSYPHKHCYRPLDETLSLSEVWRDESLTALFLYVHIPFCEMRCGFCNLFTLANAKEDMMQQYVDSLLQQMASTFESLPDARYARLAFGGGTPSILFAQQLERLFIGIQEILRLDISQVPTSFEVSPYTANREKIALLADYGVQRISMGVQSFFEMENRNIGRHQPTDELHRALDNIKAQGFPNLNLDLIYGIPGQTHDSWLSTLQQTVNYTPDEIYLYPLYVRPLTGIAKRDLGKQQDRRKELYRLGRDFLLSHGYEQISMRMFRKVHSSELVGPIYCCQEDGMLGLGVGARSYTKALHYSSRYAVRRSGIHHIISAYIQAMQDAPVINYGYHLDQEDQRRRYLILSLLNKDGLDYVGYENRFGEDVLQQFPELQELLFHGFARKGTNQIRLTSLGMEYSDSIGPWLYSRRVNELSKLCELQ